MQSRIYAITNKETGNTRLVSAANPSQAVRHVTSELFAVKAASAVTVGQLMSNGVQLEHASTKESAE